MYLLPAILPQLFAGILMGKMLGVWGYYLPWMVSSGVLQVIAYSLLATLKPHSSTGEWVGYQIIGGVGRGIGMVRSPMCGIPAKAKRHLLTISKTVPMIAVQHSLAPAQIPVAMSLLIATQTYFGALALSFADTIFINSLRSIVRNTVGGDNANAIAHAGAYAFRSIVPEGDLPAVLLAYSKSINRVFYMCIGLAVVCFVVSWGLGWVDIRQKGDKEKGKSEEK